MCRRMLVNHQPGVSCNINNEEKKKKDGILKRNGDEENEVVGGLLLMKAVGLWGFLSRRFVTCAQDGFLSG